MQTIHFARWVFLDDKKRLLFASNYDGSLESYMDDFINKVAWGINLVFSNGVGYPRTDWLIKRRRQERAEVQALPPPAPAADGRSGTTPIPGLTVVDCERNTRIREGLERPTMTDARGEGMAEAALSERRPRAMTRVRGSTSATCRAWCASATGA